jgi:hypothetical protein
MIPAAVAVVVFALNNKDPIALNLWPFALVVEQELYLVLTAVLGVGVVLGGVVSWSGGGHVRASLRKRAYEGEVARRQLQAEHEENLKLRAEVKTLKSVMEHGTQQASDDDSKTIEHAPASAASGASPGQLTKSQNVA